MDIEEIIALLAVFIAACALLATIWQAKLTRQHNRLTVRPLLVWVRDLNEFDKGTEVAFVAKNNGVGPAIIKSREFRYKEKVFESSDHDVVVEFVAEVLGKKYDFRLLQHGLPGIDTAISPGCAHTVARILFPKLSRKEVLKIFVEVGDTEFRVNYESLYKEKYLLIGA